MSARRATPHADGIGVEVYDLTAWDLKTPAEWLSDLVDAREGAEACPLCTAQPPSPSARRARVCDACERALFAGVSSTETKQKGGPLSTLLRQSAARSSR